MAILLLCQLPHAGRPAEAGEERLELSDHGLVAAWAKSVPSWAKSVAPGCRRVDAEGWGGARAVHQHAAAREGTMTCSRTSPRTSRGLPTMVNTTSDAAATARGEARAGGDQVLRY